MTEVLSDLVEGCLDASLTHSSAFLFLICGVVVAWITAAVSPDETTGCTTGWCSMLATAEEERSGFTDTQFNGYRRTNKGGNGCSNPEIEDQTENERQMAPDVAVGNRKGRLQGGEGQL
jgi:hypothetical protein